MTMFMLFVLSFLASWRLTIWLMHRSEGLGLVQVNAAFKSCPADAERLVGRES